MRGIRLCVSCQKKRFIISEENIGLAYEKCMRKQFFGRITELLNGFKIPFSLRKSEMPLSVETPAPPRKNNAPAALEHLLEIIDFLFEI